MVAFFSSCFFQIQTILTKLVNYFKSSAVGCCFFVFLFIVAILDIFKGILIWLEKKNGYPDQACKYLSSGRDSPVCNVSSRKQGFKDRNNSCEGCSGKTLSISNEEVSNYIIASGTWKRVFIVLTNCTRQMIPYVSFIYTLRLYRNILWD